MYAYSLLRKEVVGCVTKRSIRKNNPIVVFHSSVMRMSFSSRKSYQSVTVVTVVTVKAAAELLSTKIGEREQRVGVTVPSGKFSKSN